MSPTLILNLEWEGCASF